MLCMFQLSVIGPCLSPLRFNISYISLDFVSLISIERFLVNLVLFLYSKFIVTDFASFLLLPLEIIFPAISILLGSLRLNQPHSHLWSPGSCCCNFLLMVSQPPRVTSADFPSPGHGSSHALSQCGYNSLIFISVQIFCMSIPLRSLFIVSLGSSLG